MPAWEEAARPPFRALSGLRRARRRAALGTKKPPLPRGLNERTGGDLLSQAVARQVPSALRGLTALFGMGRGVSPSLFATGNPARPRPRRSLKTAQSLRENKYPSSPRRISTARLSALLRLHRRPIDLVVYQASYSLKGMGELISRTASRLDAFSAYPFRA